MNKTPNRSITTKDLEAAKRLKSIIALSPKKLSQAQIAEHMGYSTQSTVSLYLNGKAALGTDAVIGFAKLYDVEPSEIRPELAKDLGLQNRVILADYNKVIEAVEMTLVKTGVIKDYKEKIKMYEFAYNQYSANKNDQKLQDFVDYLCA